LVEQQHWCSKVVRSNVTGVGAPPDQARQFISASTKRNGDAKLDEFPVHPEEICACEKRLVIAAGKRRFLLESNF
jgi:hypothetical protein